MEQTGSVRHVELSRPIRVDAEVYAAAKVAGATRDISASKQLTYWVRLGREFERSVVSHAAIATFSRAIGRTTRWMTAIRLSCGLRGQPP